MANCKSNRAFQPKQPPPTGIFSFHCLGLNWRGNSHKGTHKRGICDEINGKGTSQGGRQKTLQHLKRRICACPFFFGSIYYSRFVFAVRGRVAGKRNCRLVCHLEGLFSFRGKNFFSLVNFIRLNWMRGSKHAAKARYRYATEW